MFRKDFFDIPVYRLSEEENEQEWINSGENKTLQDEFYKKYPEKESRDRELLRAGFGGEWRYNEIIGYIRLYIYGTQIRGEYYVNKAKKQRRSRKKQFKFSTHKLASGESFSLKNKNNEIYKIILLYLDECEKELNKARKSKKRYIDTSIFKRIGPYINWEMFFRDNEIFDYSTDRLDDDSNEITQIITPSFF